MVPSRDGGMQQSSSSSGIFFQGDGQSHLGGNSNFSSKFGNTANSLSAHARGNINIGPISGDICNTILNSVASSGPSIGASSLVTDANSGLSGGPHLQRSASINTESYMRLPTSPMSFSSNNISVSGSSVMDGSSVVQRNSNQDLGYQGASSATSLPRMGQAQLPLGGPRVPTSIQDASTLSQLQKKPRLDIKQDDIVQQQVLQQLLQRQDSIHLHNQSQLQVLIQQQRLRQQEQQLLQAMPSMQRVQLLQQQQQLQQQMHLRQQLQLQGMPPASAVKRPYDGGVCSRRLMQYLYHQRQWPAENAITYWRKFVYEYYSPHAKKRWCLSRYDNVGHQSIGVFPQSSMDAWQCDICGSKSGRGFEATFEVVPRLNEIKFSSGVIDELLFLDLPRECRFPSGMMMLEYAKAVQESVYEQLRVVREGQLRILFTPDLKILSWEFCARRHEELLPRRLVAPQVNQLLQVAQKCQSTVSENRVDGVSQQDLQTNSALVITAGRQLARTLELQSLNDLGFSKRYVRCLQIADVVNSMKDLMDFCKEHKKGPIEGLKNFPRCANVPKVPTMQKMQDMDQIDRRQGLLTDCNTLNKLMALQQHSAVQLNNQHIDGRGNLSGSAQAALALTNFQNLLMRQNSFNSTQHETLSGTPTGQNPSIGSFSVPQVQSSQALQQQMIQQLLQDMSKKDNMATQNPVSNPGGGKISSGFRNSPATPLAAAATGPPSRINSFKTAAPSNSESPAPVGLGQKEFDLPQSLHLMDDMMIPDISHDFSETGFFSNELDDNMNFSWKV